MQFKRTYSTIDVHTAGEPLRIVTAGIPFIPGDTILAKRHWVKTHLDHVRTALMYEPRGHADMYGCYLTPPVTPEADMGVIFMHNEGYSSMCGHGIIALASVAVETGMVPAVVPETRLGIDSPAGFIEAFVQWDGQQVAGVRFVNVPSFLYARDVTVETANFGTLTVDVSYGGAFYAYLEAEQVGFEVTPANINRLIQLGDEVKHATEAAMEIVHPLEPELRGIYGTIISQPQTPPVGTKRAQRNVCVFADREVDRSPTGTGTAGRVAQLYARGQLALSEVLQNASIIDTVFTGTPLQATRVGSYPAVSVEVQGSAHITGFAQWVVDERDPVGEGFLLR